MQCIQCWLFCCVVKWSFRLQSKFFERYKNPYRIHDFFGNFFEAYGNFLTTTNLINRIANPGPIWRELSNVIEKFHLLRVSFRNGAGNMPKFDHNSSMQRTRRVYIQKTTTTTTSTATTTTASTATISQPHFSMTMVIYPKMVDLCVLPK